MGERWDRDRLEQERYRGRDFERDRYEDDRYYMAGGRGRDHSDERYDRRFGRTYEDDIVSERRYHDDDSRFGPPPPRREPGFEFERERPRERRVVIEKERDIYDNPSPRRPAFLRRQSSLDTYDRRPLRNFHEREELPPPARREDVYRQDFYRDDYRSPYPPAPLPKSRGLPPPPPRGDRGDRRYYDDIKVAEPDYYGDEEYRPYRDRLQEREMIRTRRRERRGSHSRTSRRGSSPTATTTSRSSSSSSSGGTTIRSEYPKKGKTRIPARLASKRALIDLGYPFTEEGNTLIVQKALGQKNIDELLKLSEDYKKSEMEIAAARSSAGDIAEDRREVFVPPAPQRMPQEIVIPPPPPAPAPVIIEAAPPGQSSGTRVEFAEKTVIRASSPTNTTTTGSWDSHNHHHHHHYEDTSNAIPVGPLALAKRSRSASRSGRDVRAEIKNLERELVHRPRVSVSDREIVRAERLPDGQLVVYEEETEKFVGSKPPRIEKDKKGRMSISVPKYR